MNNRQVAASFASGMSSGTGSNFYISGDYLYSYGPHFVVARRLPSGILVIATRRYSPSTDQHISYVRQAAHFGQAVYCYNPAWTAASNRAQVLADLAALKQDMDKPRIRPATIARLHVAMLEAQRSFNRYLAALTLYEQVGIVPFHIEEEPSA